MIPLPDELDGLDKSAESPIAKTKISFFPLALLNDPKQDLATVRRPAFFSVSRSLFRKREMQRERYIERERDREVASKSRRLLSSGMAIL